MSSQQAEFADILEELSKLSSAELKELFNTASNQRYDELVNKNEKIKNLEAERDLLLASVRSLAEFNLVRQNEYERDRLRLSELVVDCNRSKDDIKARAAKLLCQSKGLSLEKVTVATTISDEESERIASNFINKQLEYDLFLDQYSEKRKLAHLLRIKAEKLRQESTESWTDIHTRSSGLLSQ